MTASNDLLRRVLDAYGGEARWSAIQIVTLHVSAHGLAFRMKHREPMVRVPAEIDAHQPLVRFFPEQGAGLIEVFAGNEVRLERPDGRVVEARSNPRRFFPGGRRLLWWDRLDQIYFAGYALWNYVTFPALLTRGDVEWEASGDSTLRARFSADFPTHSETQEFHVDPQTGLLTQHDYTAGVFGNWAKAAHCVLAHEEVDGILFATHRRVTPRRMNGKPARFPLLVGIDFDTIGVD